MSEELKDCPFCGGEASLVTGAPEVWVRCMTCHASGDTTSDAKRAAFKWNSRYFVVGKSHQAILNQLVSALKFYADAWCFTTNPKRGGLEWKPTEKLLDDCGNVARAALSPSSPPAE